MLGIPFLENKEYVWTFNFAFILLCVRLAFPISLGSTLFILFFVVAVFFLSMYLLQSPNKICTWGFVFQNLDVLIYKK